MSFKNAIGFFVKSGGVVLDPDTVTLLAAMTEQPTAALANLIDVTIKGLKADGVYALGDCLWVRGVHASQAGCLNWIKRAHDSTPVNAPTFTPKQGFTGDGISSYLNNNYTPSAHTDNFKQTTASLFIMQMNVGDISSSIKVGAINTTTRRIELNNNPSGNELIRLNSTTTPTNTQVNHNNGDYVGYTLTGGAIQGYKNGSVEGLNVAITQGTLVGKSLLSLARNGTTVVDGYNNGQESVLWLGDALTATQQLALYTRMKYFYDNVNATF